MEILTKTGVSVDMFVLGKLWRSPSANAYCDRCTKISGSSSGSSSKARITRFWTTPLLQHTSWVWWVPHFWQVSRYPFITIIYNPSFMVESNLLMDKSQFFLLKSQKIDTPPKSSSLPTNLDDLGLRWLKKPISDFYIFLYLLYFYRYIHIYIYIHIIVFNVYMHKIISQ